MNLIKQWCDSLQ